MKKKDKEVANVLDEILSELVPHLSAEERRKGIEEVLQKVPSLSGNKKSSDNTSWFGEEEEDDTPYYDTDWNDDDEDFYAKFYTYQQPNYSSMVHDIPTFLKGYLCFDELSEKKARRLVDKIQSRKTLTREKLINEVRNLILWSFCNLPDDIYDDREHVDLIALFLLIEHYNLTELQGTILEILRQPYSYFEYYNVDINAAFYAIVNTMFSEDIEPLKQFVKEKGYFQGGYRVVMAVIANKVYTAPEHRDEILTWVGNTMKENFAVLGTSACNDFVLDYAMFLAIHLKAENLMPLVKEIIKTDHDFIDATFTHDYKFVMGLMERLPECDHLHTQTVDKYYDNLRDVEFNGCTTWESDFDEDFDNFDSIFFGEYDDEENIDGDRYPNETCEEWEDHGKELTAEEMDDFIEMMTGQRMHPKKKPIPSSHSCKIVPLFPSLIDPFEMVSKNDLEEMHCNITELFECNRSKIAKLRLMTYAKQKEYDECVMDLMTAESIDDKDRIVFYMDQCNNHLRKIIGKYKQLLHENPTIKDNPLVKELIQEIVSKGIPCSE